MVDGVTVLWRAVRADLHPAISARQSGSARFRQPGTTRVVLVSVGPNQDRVITIVRLVARVDQERARNMVAGVPSLLAEHVGLASADLIVESLAAVGAATRVEHEETWVSEPPAT